jgi:hypothetical protein
MREHKQERDSTQDIVRDARRMPLQTLKAAVILRMLFSWGQLWGKPVDDL